MELFSVKEINSFKKRGQQLIKVENLVKNYGEVKAVKSISFEVKNGEILGFLGENGAGKSTTLKIISGYLTQTSGNVTIDGMNSKQKSYEIKNMIGYLPELNPLYTEMRVYDYLKFIAGTYNIIDGEFNTSLDRVVEQCGLSGYVHKKIAECSKGYKQRTGLASALIHDPKILLLDEPVSGLDPNQRIEIRKLIQELGKEKVVMVSSHNLDQIKATVDRMIIIDNGELVADGTADELVKKSKGSNTLNLEIKTKSDLKEIDFNIESVTLIDSIKKEDIYHLTFEYPSNLDAREEIFQFALKNQWVILGMTTSGTSLEDVFRTLTMEEIADA